MLTQQIVTGLITGGVYSLFALGFTLVFGIHNILNLAQGAIFTAGAFIAYYCVVLGLPLWIAFAFAIVGCGLLSVIIERLAFHPLADSGEAEFGAMISSIGVSLILTSIAQKVSNTQVFRFPFETFPVVFFRILGVRVSLLQIFMLAFAMFLMVAILIYLNYTRFGRQVRAVASNERASVLMGINPNAVFFQTFFVSGALAGAAGVLVGLAFNSIHFMMGEPYLLRGFVVIVLGGIGSIPGAMLAGLLLGVIQTMTTAYLSAGLTEAIIFSILFLILIIRPNGLLGRTSVTAMRAER